MAQRPKLSLRTVKAELKPLGVTVRKTPYDDYRVNFIGGPEAFAYYASDLEDALATGILMAAHHRKI